MKKRFSAFKKNNKVFENSQKTSVTFLYKDKIKNKFLKTNL